MKKAARCERPVEVTGLTLLTRLTGLPVRALEDRADGDAEEDEGGNAEDLEKDHG